MPASTSFRVVAAAGCTLGLLAVVFGRTPAAQGRSTSGPDLASISASRIVAHAAFLSDDLLEGRAPGARGGELAARYIATQFALLGLEPGAADGTYYQPVPIVEATVSREATTMSAKGADGSPIERAGRAIEIVRRQADETWRIAIDDPYARG